MRKCCQAASSPVRIDNVKNMVVTGWLATTGWMSHHGTP
ncbi:Uncharacterised protein [Mycobacterium tuberculosis]|nr:Uncharacterised protein [Mycobacterium tuberculosis]